MNFLLLRTLLFFLPFLPRAALGVRMNQTIDDTYGDSMTHQIPTYLPSTPGVWNNQSCTECSIHPDKSLAFSGTYSEATYFKQSKDPLSISLKFHGTAIYVFFIFANDAGPDVVTETMANFTLDNQPPQLRHHVPDMSTKAMEYNACIFSQEDLTNTEHTLVISVSDIQQQVYVNFDYAIYTYEDPADSKKKFSSGQVAGAVSGAIALVVLLVLGHFLLLRRRKKHQFKRLYATSLFSRESDSDGNSVNVGAPVHTLIDPFPLPYDSPAPAARTPETPLIGTDMADYLANPTGAVRSLSYNNYGSTSTAPQTPVVTEAAAAPRPARQLKVVEMRRARQEELLRRLHAAQYEMTQVNASINNSNSTSEGAEAASPTTQDPLHVSQASTGPRDPGRGREASMDEMKETLRTLRLQVQRLEQQRDSAWAQGLSDSPPPGYVPDATQPVHLRAEARGERSSYM